MSQHSCLVIKINSIEPHPNADNLEIIKIDGWQVCAKKGQFKLGSLAIYIAQDYVVRTDRSEFAFLATSGEPQTVRIKPRKLRGILSEGLLIEAPPGALEGQDYMPILGIERWEPKIEFSSGGEDESAPSIDPPKYDVESFQKYASCFVNEEEVYASEKIHGSNSRFLYDGSRMYCGSHNHWKRQDTKNLWWKCLAQHPEVQLFCEAHPNVVVYAEIFGPVQNFKYGAKPGEIKLAVFDLYKDKRFLDIDEALALGESLQWAPLIYKGPLNEFDIKLMACGNSLVPGAQHVREGLVLRPAKERWNQEMGRVIAKIINPDYFTRT